MKILLEPDKIYHIFNHANGNENLFVNEDNFFFFLKQYSKYINPIADTYAYCLMPNHIHFAVRIKTLTELTNLQGIENLEGFEPKKFIYQQFSNFFNSYTKAFNKQQDRMGSLFMKNFRRKLIDTNEYFKQIIHYIHYNPVHHCFADDLRDWKFSSYETYFSDKTTNLKRSQAIELFTDKQSFFDYHQRDIDDKLFLDLE